MKNEAKKLSARIEALLGRMRVDELALAMRVSVATVYRWKDGNVQRPSRLLIEALERVESGRKAVVK